MKPNCEWWEQFDDMDAIDEAADTMSLRIATARQYGVHEALIIAHAQRERVFLTFGFDPLYCEWAKTGKRPRTQRESRKAALEWRRREGLDASTDRRTFSEMLLSETYNYHVAMDAAVLAREHILNYCCGALDVRTYRLILRDAIKLSLRRFAILRVYVQYRLNYELVSAEMMRMVSPLIHSVERFPNEKRQFVAEFGETKMGNIRIGKEGGMQDNIIGIIALAFEGRNLARAMRSLPTDIVNQLRAQCPKPSEAARAFVPLDAEGEATMEALENIAAEPGAVSLGEFMERETVNEIRRLIETPRLLSPQQREIMRIVLVEPDSSYADIAARIDSTEGNVGYQLSEARRKLREAQNERE